MPTILIDPKRICVRVGECDVQLTPQEYRVFYCLASHVGQVVAKRELHAVLLGAVELTPTLLSTLDPSAVDLVIFRIRKKLKDQELALPALETRRGFGYILHDAQILEMKNDASENSNESQGSKGRSEGVNEPTSLFSDLPHPRQLLTRREWDIFSRLGEEQTVQLTDKALAQQLRIAEGTLKKHLQNIYRKLNINNRPAASFLAMKFCWTSATCEEMQSL